MSARKNGTTTTGGRRVLLVEDNFFMAQLLMERLKKAELEASHASSDDEARQMLKKNAPDALVVDVPLHEGGDYCKLVEDARKERHIPALVLFDKDDENERKRAQTCGIESVMVKRDITVSDIVAEAQRLAKGGGPAPAAPPETEPAKKSARNGKAKASAKEPKDLSDVAGADPKQIQDLKDRIQQIVTKPEAEISIIALVDTLMGYAFLTRASDIHLEPTEENLLARLRIDGILRDSFTFPKGIHPGIISRIKVLGAMRTDEHQAAQDGRFRISMQDSDRQFDVRVSIVPTYYGENAVLRLLAEQTKLNSLDDVALSEADRKKVRKAVKTPYGMILATGPTGSGKTTTLYTILKELSTREVSIITIEDPIEYSLEGIDQIQVNNRTGLTFAAGLRSILRQDPNIIMVGEIRDEETASIAVNAALTGHKLLSTLHTNDAATTLPRLLDMGVEPFLVASTVNVAMGQRLVRMICENCKEPRRITEGEFMSLKDSLTPEILDDHRDFYIGKGCDMCGHTGYKGRMGIYEILEVNDFIREAIMRHADASEIKKIAIKNGMTTLLEDGFQKALKGLTTIEEILRVIHE
ncbi:MAG TPA: ATPase, T2SS/T4P/T4SS family [Candidatus Paceibacterota bacterium]|nr:ATPase, T2SS/T4P/T4SS family [Candidatus Paceibacterota bacterium]